MIAERHNKKTEIVIKYAYHHPEANAQTWVFWVHASSAVRFEESYRRIAWQVQISSCQDPKADVLSIVHAWLSDENNGRWMMVVDNADCSQVVFGSRSSKAQTLITSFASSTALIPMLSDRSLADYCPMSAHGSIVITSRS